MKAKIIWAFQGRFMVPRVKLNPRNGKWIGRMRFVVGHDIPDRENLPRMRFAPFHSSSRGGLRYCNRFFGVPYYRYPLLQDRNILRVLYHQDGRIFASINI